ncbi:hypothetical protein PRIPAC_96415, partial [Pristionchus pacificus]
FRMPARKRRSTSKSTGNEPAPKHLAINVNTRDEQEATIKAKLDEMRSFMEQRFTALEEQLSARPPVGKGNSRSNGEDGPMTGGENDDDDAVSQWQQDQGDYALTDADPASSAQRTRPEVIAKRLCARVGGIYYDTALVWREIGICEGVVELFDAVAQATLNGHDMTRIIERFKAPLTQSFKQDYDKKIQELRDEGADIPQMIQHISIAGEAALGNILKGAHISIMRAFNKLRRDTEYDKRVVRLDALFRDDCLSLDYVVDALGELFDGIDKSRIDPKMVSDIKATITDAKQLFTKVHKVVEDQKDEKEITRECEKIKQESNKKVTQLRSTIDRQAQEISNLRAQLARKNAEEPSTSGASL